MARKRAGAQVLPLGGASESDRAYVLECDGASFGNPGHAGVGVRLAGPRGETVEEISEPIGSATNNVAEYRALIRGLELAAARGVRRIAIRMDSELVVRQVLGRYRTREAHLQDLLAEAIKRLRSFDEWTIDSVPRGANARADALAKAGASRQEVEGGGTTREG
jgi:ribonuclease HI